MEPEVINRCRESVLDRLQRSGPMPWEQAVRIAATVADCLAVAHDRGQVHGCVRPQLVLLSTNGLPRLTGFAAAADASTGSTGKIAARSPEGMTSLQARPVGRTASPEEIADLLHTAPEVLDGDRPDPAADIYSLAATLHHLVTGQPPFPLHVHDSFASWFIRIVTQPAPALPEHVPPGLRRLVGQALAKDRTDRPACAAEFAARLRRFLPGPAVVIPLRRRPQLP
jgi:serine/threonine protein kinase